MENRTIMTLDAGGTNFVFSAIRDYQEVMEPIRYPSNAHDLDLCLKTLFEGFTAVKDRLSDKPVAISFAFPGPADYEKGIIGDLPNFKAFNDGVPMGPMLEEQFKLPVFINNDGNLFAYGEALYGFLPRLNQKIIDSGGIKQFRNLIGVTLGTGFGGGIVLDNRLVIGDSSCGAEVHNSLNKFNPNWNAEESVSTRAIQRVYGEYSGIEFPETLMPYDIFEIAAGRKEGNANAAKRSFETFGEGLGNSLANILTLIDGIAVLGGGITAAWDLFAPSMFREINRKYENFKGEKTDRLSFEVFNLEDEGSFGEFAVGQVKYLPVPGSEKKVAYDPAPRTGIGFSKIGASKAIAFGAYAFALEKLNAIE